MSLIFKDASDNLLISNVKNKNCDDSFIELCYRYEKIFYNSCSNFARRYPFLQYEEIICDMMYVLNKSLQTFDEEKSVKFSTWFTHMARFHLLNMCNSWSKNNFITTYDVEKLAVILKYIKDETPDSNKNLFLKDFIFKKLNQLKDDRILKIYEMRYFDSEKNWTAIAKKLNLTGTYIKLLHDKGITFLQKSLKEENSL